MIIMPQKYSLTVDGTNLSTFKVYQSGNQTFGSAERDREFVTVPGKSGTLILDNGRFENVERPYTCFIVDNFRTNIRKLADFLASIDSYVEIHDTYHPDEYVLGVPKPLDPEVLDNMLGGEFELVFNCKPQRYLVTDDIVFTGNGTKSVRNPTNQKALPLITMNGAGIVTFGNQSITTTSAGIIDTELMTMTNSNGDNLNNNVVFNVDQIQVPPGNVTITSTVACTIKPRWWTA